MAAIALGVLPAYRSLLKLFVSPTQASYFFQTRLRAPQKSNQKRLSPRFGLSLRSG
ncbi:hypothetical protein [Pseudomonas sp. AS2.8]|uniref:hypothetical protein n=1 Tax=Pseudomonas sp. AS2.8 TaxID=2587128 RepID=UPI0016113417|nr:hypothetical protein [Pseudomonas sp. AS2.8]MBB2898417.1 hypothetical protein [Pseudomonas sp. AS2.8]